MTLCLFAMFVTTIYYYDLICTLAIDYLFNILTYNENLEKSSNSKKKMKMKKDID